MNNKKKFSSFKNQQMLVEGFRNFVAESEQDLPEEESYSEITEEEELEEAPKAIPGGAPSPKPAPSLEDEIAKAGGAKHLDPGQGRDFLDNWHKIYLKKTGKTDVDQDLTPMQKLNIFKGSMKGKKRRAAAQAAKTPPGPNPPKQTKSRAIQKYGDIAKMLRSHGMDIPEDPVERHAKINSLLDANKIKPKSWKDMYDKLEHAFGTSQTAVGNKKGRAKHTKWLKKATSDVAAKDTKEKERRKALTPGQRGREDMGGGIKRGMKRFMNKLNLGGLGGPDEGKEMPYDQLVEIITQTLMKHESFKKLFEEKSLKFKKKDVK